MEPFENDELTDQELDSLLAEWKAPQAPAGLRESLFPNTSESWWRRLWGASIRVPLPAAVSIAVVMGVAAWRLSVPVAPRVVVRTERVEVPATKEPDRNAGTGAQTAARRFGSHELRPVAELRPVIIRRAQ